MTGMRGMAVAAALCLAARAEAQDTLPPAPGLPQSVTARVVEDAAVLERVPVLLPEDHWAVRAVARLHGMGVADRYFPSQRAVPLSVVAAALRDAASRAAFDPFGHWTAVDWLRRLRAEFAAVSAEGIGMLPRQASVGVAREFGRLSPVEGYFDTRGVPAPVGGATRPQVRASTGFTLGGIGAAWAQGRYDERGLHVPRWDVAAAAGPIALSVGRQPVGYGHAR
ncbi:MAG TPA: hypothetical protein VFQ45_10875, partial [Longimicrobium sp.]|nr:hypothetical protein [Longimicrobium sp.]